MASAPRSDARVCTLTRPLRSRRRRCTRHPVSNCGCSGDPRSPKRGRSGAALPRSTVLLAPTRCLVMVAARVTPRRKPHDVRAGNSKTPESRPCSEPRIVPSPSPPPCQAHYGCCRREMSWGSICLCLGHSLARPKRPVREYNPVQIIAVSYNPTRLYSGWGGIPGRGLRAAFLTHYLVLRNTSKKNIS